MKERSSLRPRVTVTGGEGSGKRTYALSGPQEIGLQAERRREANLMCLDGWTKACQFLFDWQTLITGLMALLAALAGVLWGTMMGSEKPIRCLFVACGRGGLRQTLKC
jgi:hypothetical protein